MYDVLKLHFNLSVLAFKQNKFHTGKKGIGQGKIFYIGDKNKSTWVLWGHINKTRTK